MDTITVYCKNLERIEELPIGTTLESIAQRYCSELGFTALNCRVNNQTFSLAEKLYEPAELYFSGISEESGQRTYVRTLSFVMSKAAYDVIPNVKVHVLHSLSNGYYCTIQNQENITAEQLAQIKRRMDELIAMNLPFEAHTVPAEEASQLFRRMGMQDKVDLIETAGQLYYTYYTLDDYCDSYYGSLTPSTGYLYLYDLIPCNGGGVLMRVPDMKNPRQLAPLVEQPKLRKLIAQQTRLLTTLNLQSIGALNRAVENKSDVEMIQVSEAVQEKEIAAIASTIAERYTDGVRIILVSGPSSSGKTTFSKRLRTQLITNFLHPYSISLDDYFVNREYTPRDDSGEYDYESIYALDLETFNKDLSALLRGEEVRIPTFDFTLGKRIYKGNTLQLKEGDLLLLEGIHALNPLLIPSIPPNATFKIYVSALTAVSLDGHNRIPSTDNRLLRRLVRDYRYRNYSAIETLRRWPSVRRGEEKWVFPHQEEADAMFNSAMMYELAILRRYAEPILREVPQNVPEYGEAQRLLRFLEQINFISARTLPPISLLREFVGGSSFKY